MNPGLERLILAYDDWLTSGHGRAERRRFEFLLAEFSQRPAELERAIRFHHRNWLRAQRKPTDLN